MTIPYFAGHQTDVFLPALLTVLLATVLGVVPMIFAPALRRTRSGRTVSWLLAVAAVVIAALAVVLQGIPAGQRLHDEYRTVQQAIADRYGLQLPIATVHALVRGDTLVVPEADLGAKQTVRLQRVAGDRYVLTTGGAAGELPRG